MTRLGRWVALLAAAISSGCNWTIPIGAGSPSGLDGGSPECGVCEGFKVCGGAGIPGQCDYPIPTDIARACAAEPIRSTGAVHYACDCQAGASARCQPGDDSASGTSPSHPWRTLEKMRTQFGSLAAGDTLAFCRGGSFDVSGARWENYDCRAASTCDVRDYAPPWGEGSEGRPIVRASGTAFELSCNGNPRHREGYRFLNLEIRGDGSSPAFFLYNDIDDVDLCNLLIDGMAMNLAGSNPPGAGGDASDERVHLRGSRVMHATGYSFIGSGPGLTIEETVFDDNADRRVVDITGATDGSGTFQPAAGIRFVNNVMIRRSTLACSGVFLRVSGQLEGLAIENNLLVDEGGTPTVCNGIYVAPDTAQPEYFHDAVIRNNRLFNLQAIQVGACQRCLIENNLAVNTVGTVAFSILLGARAKAADEASTAYTARNNTIVLGSGTAGYGIVLSSEGTGHLLVSNALLYRGGGDWTCLQVRGPTDVLSSDYNLCWYPQATGGSWGTGQASLADWQTASGLDLHSRQQDPLFRDSGGPRFDFAPAPGSPLLNAGAPYQSAPLDLTGRSRDSQPDIGAYESP